MSRTVLATLSRNLLTFVSVTYWRLGVVQRSSRRINIIHFFIPELLVSIDKFELVFLTMLAVVYTHIGCDRPPVRAAISGTAEASVHFTAGGNADPLVRTKQG